MIVAAVIIILIILIFFVLNYFDSVSAEKRNKEHKTKFTVPKKVNAENANNVNNVNNTNAEYVANAAPVLRRRQPIMIHRIFLPALNPNRLATAVINDNIDIFANGFVELEDLLVQHFNELIINAERAHDVKMVENAINTMEEKKTQALEVVVNNPDANATEEFLNSLETHTSDNQNVHDNSVVQNIKSIMTRIKEDQKTMVLSSTVLIDTMQNEFKNFDGNKKEIVEEVIEYIKRDTAKLVVVDMTLSEILARIYARGFNNANLEKRQTMLENLYDNLYQCKEDGSILCTTGCAIRIISSISMLDEDERNWEINKSEDYRNIIHAKLKLIIEDVENDTSKILIPENIETTNPKDRMMLAFTDLLSQYTDGYDKNTKHYVVYDNNNNIKLHKNILDVLKSEGAVAIDLTE